MNLIECEHCQKKYTLQLEKIPKTPKKWKCSACQQIFSHPFYSEKEQEFLMDIDIACESCKKKYAIPSSKFTASKMQVFCSFCKHKFQINFSNFDNIQRLNQQVSRYLNDKPSPNKIFREDKNKIQKLVQEVTKETPKNLSIKQTSIEEVPNNNLEDFQNWENKNKEQKGLVPAELLSSIFIDNNKVKIDNSDLPSLTSKVQKKNDYPKKKQKNIGISFFLFILFLLIIILYIYTVNS